MDLMGLYLSIHQWTPYVKEIDRLNEFFQYYSGEFEEYWDYTFIEQMKCILKGLFPHKPITKEFRLKLRNVYEY